MILPSIRLDKLLAGQGFGSRHEVKTMLARGRVVINGQPIKNADCRVDTSKDTVLFDGRQINYKEHLYIMMNKPRGVISASNDPKQPTVIDLLPEPLRRPGLFPAGRLDKDTEGMLIITDDGDFAHQILSPRKHVPKRYFAEVTGTLLQEAVRSFAEGLELGDGTLLKPAALQILENQGDSTQVEVIISEGKYHQIKRMFEQLGHTVLILRRLSMGGLQLDPTLNPGDAREMTAQEVALVRNATIQGNGNSSF